MQHDSESLIYSNRLVELVRNFICDRVGLALFAIETPSHHLSLARGSILVQPTSSGTKFLHHYMNVFVVFANIKRRRSYIKHTRRFPLARTLIICRLRAMCYCFKMSAPAVMCASETKYFPVSVFILAPYARNVCEICCGLAHTLAHTLAHARTHMWNYLPLLS